MAHISGNINGFQDSTYPVDGLVPKSETGVMNFLQKYPEYNGKDVTIAIFDSGVDPRASGLETLCDGKSVKVIERFDCTGCGDVNVSARASADAKGYLAGLSGRHLKLTPQMIAANTANGEYRLGLKNFYDLVPSKVRDNVTLASKVKDWDGPHKTAIAETARKITEFEAQNPDSSKLSWDKKLTKDDLDSTMELLNSYEKIYLNVKTTYDCILYPTESGWQTVIDTTEKGDLANALHIGEYTNTYEIKNIDDYLSVSVNVHDDGNVLEVVGICTSHGTHVASIAGGNGSSKDVNGVAPNAKIVSLTIGDGRLGSMETGAGLVRAMIKVMEMCREGRQIDVINMSYGEHAHWSNTGRIGELMSEVVNKYGVVWVASAGNHGPALATVGTPPDISQPSCIGVGAYISPQMMEAEYVMREKLPANVYTWTSRDPCIDGGQGVTICAPGAAITSVPQYTMTKSQHMNGTSMAAPHVAGAVGLLISGLKQRGIPYSPFSIKRAICATATYLSYVDPFAQGSGLLNVEKAFEHLVEYANAPENMIRFAVRCGPHLKKGIHIREGVLQKALEYNVSIEPIFFNDREVAREDKFNFNLRLNLISSQPYVQCGSFLDLSYAARSVLVKVNPSGLPPGVHSAVIRGYDSECVNKGSLFEIPVTIVQPHTINSEVTRCFEPATNRADGTVEFQPNTIQRHFILVPRQATWAVLRMRATDQNRENSVGKFFIHTNQLLPKASCRTMETMKYLSVGSEQDTVWIFNCQGNNIVEVCIAKYWSNYGSTHLKYNVEFHGIQPITPNAYVMHAGNGIHKLELSALVCEDLQPQIQLKTAAVVLRPTEAKISPLGARDVIPEGRQIYQHVLTYSLTVPKLQEVAIYAPIFNSMLYEAEFESQLWMVFDVNQMMVSCGDAHSHKFYAKLDKGEFTVRLQIRHEKRELLEKVAETNMVALFKLGSSISLDIYDHYNQCVIGGRKTTNGMVKDNPTRALYIGLMSQERINKANLPPNTAWLSGVITFAKDEPTKKVVIQKFLYVLSPPEVGGKKNGNGMAAAGAASMPSLKVKTPLLPTVGASTTTLVSASGDAVSTTVVSSSPSSSGDIGSPKKAKSNADEYFEGLRDFQCSMITKCELEKAEKIYSEVIAAHPKHLAAHLLLAQNLESNKLKPLYPFAFVASLEAEKNKEIEKANEMEKETEKEIEKEIEIVIERESSAGKPVEEEVNVRATLERIVQLADIVIKETDKDALLAYYGLKIDTRADAAKIKINMDKQRSTLVEALIKKGVTMIKLAIIDNQLKDVLTELDNMHMELMKYVEASDFKVILFFLWHAYAHGHYGRMHKCLQKLIDERRSRDVLEEYLPVISALQLAHIEPVLRRTLVTAFPQSYRLF